MSFLADRGSNSKDFNAKFNTLMTFHLVTTLKISDVVAPLSMKTGYSVQAIAVLVSLEVETL